MVSSSPVASPISSVAILGTCVSRDLIRIATGDTVAVKPYIARSTVRSALAEPPGKLQPGRPPEAASGFEKRNFDIDVDKSVFRRLAASSADICIIDMIDERLPTWQRDNSILVASKGFEAALGRLGPPWKYVPPAAAHRETIDRSGAWARRLREVLGDRPIILHRALWARESGVSEEILAEQNGFLTELYDSIEANLTGVKSVSADPSLLIAAPEHMWGTAPYHYIDAYYRDVWEKILAVVPEMVD